MMKSTRKAERTTTPKSSASARWSRSPRVKAAAVAAVVLTTTLITGLYDGLETIWVAVTATAVAAFSAASYLSWKTLSRHVGVLTALAALAVTWAAFTAALATAAPVCPGVYDPTPDRCTTAETAQLAVGALLNPVLLVVIAVPFLAIRYTYRIFRQRRAAHAA